MSRKFIACTLLSLVMALPSVIARPARFKILASGQDRADVDAQTMVIHDADTLRTVWDEIHKNAEQSYSAEPTLPAVDFTKHTVVFIRMQQQGDSNSHVEVTRVVKQTAQGEKGPQTVVTVQESVPEGCSMITIAGHWAPFTLVEIDGTQEVVFQRVKKLISCEELPQIR